MRAEIVEPRSLNGEQRRAWRGLNRMTLRLRQQLAHGLGQVSPLSVADFEVLDALPDRPGETVPFAALARTLRWQASHLAHQLTRMEGRGLVRRRRPGTDRRSVHVERTEEGHRIHAVALRCQAQSLHRTLLEVATEDQLAAIADVCEDVLDVLDESRTARDAADQ